MSVRRIVTWTAAIVATVAALIALSYLSGAPLRARGNAAARLRLSWSARPERIEVCRVLSAEELARREEHMRQRVECDGRFATYELRVDADGRPLHRSIVRGAGLRHDRPLYLLQELDVRPGVHHLQISFVRREKTDNDAAAFAPVATTGPDTGLFAGRAQREVVERARRAGAAIPPRLELDTTVTLTAEAVLLVSFDHDRRALRLLGGSP
jgi:hypothetical protein